MKVKELVQHLLKYANSVPGNADTEVMLRFDGNLCIELGGALEAKGIPGERFLIMAANEKGKKFIMKDVKIQ